MAKQKGVIKFGGSIGDISFYKGRDGNYLARAKAGISGDRIKNGPAFVRTRENGQEFGRAGKAGKLVRTAFREAIKNNRDSRMPNRLTHGLMKIIQADTVNPRGERAVRAEHVHLIQGFDFNEGAKTSTVLSLPFPLEIGRAGGSISLTLPAFIPANAIVAPKGATHAQLVLGCSEVDFVSGTFVTAYNQSLPIPLTGEEQAQITLGCAFTAGSALPCWLYLAPSFTRK